MKLLGKTMLITGGRRVGASLALAAAERGANVSLSYFRSREIIERVADKVRALGRRAVTVQADLRRADDAQKLVDTTVKELGSVDVLVNMASEFSTTPFTDLKAHDFDAAIESNLKGPYLVSIAAARQMQRQSIVDGVQGKIINFTDWAVDRPYAGFLPYFIAKGGLATMTKALAVELAPTIAVNAVAPAMIDPPPDLSAEDIEAIRLAAPLQRIGCAADAVNLVLYLVEGTDFTTGNIYRVDGGRFLGT